jgi:hypothetical protein
MEMLFGSLVFPEIYLDSIEQPAYKAQVSSYLFCKETTIKINDNAIIVSDIGRSSFLGEVCS